MQQLWVKVIVRVKLKVGVKVRVKAEVKLDNTCGKLTTLLARGLQFLNISSWCLESIARRESRAPLTLSKRERGRITQRKL
jgi:hypothetical protein